ncbi:MAG: hypothetical protein IT430_17400 [Phycisphaerales bacterium]|nr:hypothetical protein [Phycisphaerales bacterium]
MQRLFTAQWLLGLAAWGSIASAAPPSYEVQFLGARYTATAINESGSVVGNLDVDGTRLRAAVSHNGLPFELLPLPPGMETSRAHDINDQGVVVGAVCPNQYVITQPLAALWRPVGNSYEVELLGVLEGDSYSSAYAINTQGDVVGGSGFFGWSLTHPVLFTDTGPMRLPHIGAATDVNDRRHVVSGPQLLDLNTMNVQTFPLPPGNWQGFVSAALNNNDDFAGYVAGYSGCSTFPVRYRQSAGWDFLGGCATTTSATAINDRGDTLFYYYFTSSGVYLQGEGSFSIGELIDPSQGPWLVEWFGANDINESRQIIAYALNLSTNERGAVLLSPIDLYSLTVTNLIGGSDATFTIVNATPSVNQYIVYSLRGLGSTFVPQLNVTLDLAQPTLLTSGRADAQGVLQKSVHVPPAATGRTVWFQGAEMNRTTGVISDIVR